MVSTVKSRPNHYEVLGLKPSAVDEEIAQAFAKKMLSPRSMSELAQIGVAFDTLRDPGKRRAYDESIGLGPKPAPRLSPGAQWQGGAFLIRAAAQPRERPAVDLLRRLERKPSPPPQPEPRAEPEAAAIVASLHGLAKPGIYEVQQSQPEEPVEREPPTGRKPDDTLDPVIDHILAVGRAERDKLREEKRTFSWRRPALAAGGLLVGAGLIGVLAGLSVKDNETPAEAEPSLSVPLPAAKHESAVVAAAPDRGAAGVEALPPVDMVVPQPKAGRTAFTPRTARPAEDRLADVSRSLAVPSEESPQDEQGAVAESPTATVVPASLPLPNSVVARTIARVGYSCGQVTSTSAVEGDAPGVFKVTCTSGQTYRAAPVRGRYHFRRWSSR